MVKDMYQKRKERQENKKNETYDEKKTSISCLISIYGNTLIIPYKIREN